mmetsp:Transcript_5606/g.14197  ORF Transcript_5606/g.14197 Transcript_5606/m.14197 type:complete len:214 (-) Transcript_5606:460-1101(-)
MRPRGPRAAHSFSAWEDVVAAGLGCAPFLVCFNVFCASSCSLAKKDADCVYFVSSSFATRTFLSRLSASMAFFLEWTLPSPGFARSMSLRSASFSRCRLRLSCLRSRRRAFLSDWVSSSSVFSTFFCACTSWGARRLASLATMGMTSSIAMAGTFGLIFTSSTVGLGVKWKLDSACSLWRRRLNSASISTCSAGFFSSSSPSIFFFCSRYWSA